MHKIVSATALAQAVISVLLQRPDDARARPGDYFKKDDRYDAIFGDDKMPLPIYITCVRIVRRAEEFLESLGIEQGDQRNMLFYVASQLACDLCGEAEPSVETLLEKVKPEAMTDKIVDSSYRRVLKAYETLAKKADKDAVARGTDLVKRLILQTKRRLGRQLVASDD